MGEENFDDALTPWSTLTDVSAARVRPLGHAVDARLAIPRSFEDLKPRMFAISNPAVEHLNLINCLDILSQAMWTLSSAASFTSGPLARSSFPDCALDILSCPARSPNVLRVSRAQPFPLLQSWFRNQWSSLCRRVISRAT
jgi:hypothetical protein